MNAKKIRRYLVAGAVAGLLGLGACTNPDVPAGHEGYVYYTPLIWGQMEYRESLRGPASTGVSWRLFVTNVDMREKNYPEQFQLLTADDLNVSFEVNTRIRLKRGSVKEIVEEWGGTSWYDWNVKEPLRTVVRRKVMTVSASEIQLETDAIAKDIQHELEGKYADTPIDILSVDIGHFEFPTQVTQAIEEKIAAQQELERQRFILQKTKKEAAIRVLESIRVARQQSIITSTLDPLYVQREAVQVYKKLGKSPNQTFIVLPNTPDGTGMPLVHTEGTKKEFTDETRRYLDEKASKWMDVVQEFGVDPEEVGEGPGQLGVPSTPTTDEDPVPKPPGGAGLKPAAPPTPEGEATGDADDGEAPANGDGAPANGDEAPANGDGAADEGATAPAQP